MEEKQTHRKITLIRLFLIFTLVTSIVMIDQSNFAVAMEPSRLRIYAGPASVPADNTVYEIVYLQLQDVNSRPARALQDTTISLSSSLTSVGEVDSTVTINKGSTYAVAKFHSTFTPGTTTIVATASGYATVQTSLVTVAPVPSRLAVYGFPPVLPSDGASYDALVVQLQDSSGSPAKAPLAGITVILSSSNSAIASVTASTVISGGQTYAMASITSNAPGSATITAMTSGYTSAQGTIRTEVPSTTQPTSLLISVAPPRTLADNTEHQQIIVQLLDIAGKITQQPSTPIAIQLTSSDENVGKVQSNLAIPTGKVYATATFATTYKAGTTTITAAATNLQADTETITTIGPIPSKITVYCSPSVLPADNIAYNAIQVQLQDAAGNPAKDPNGDVTVSLFSSDPTVGTVPTTLKIPFGNTYATATFTSTFKANPTTITAQASGYTTGQAPMTTYIIDQSSLTVTVTATPSNVASGQQTSVKAYVTDPGGNPTTGATVQFTSSSGGTFATTAEQGNGYYSTTFTAPNLDIRTNITITATVSKTDYTTSHGDTQILVGTSLNTGTMQVCIKDDSGQPVSEAIVSTLSQPAGMNTLMDITNSSGYVTFPNAMEGPYTINVNKIGYRSTNQTFDFSTNSPVLTLSVTKSADSQASGDLTMVWVVLVVIVIVVVVVAVMLVRRRNAAKYKLPPGYPKHYKPPPISPMQP